METNDTMKLYTANDLEFPVWIYSIIPDQNGIDTVYSDYIFRYYERTIFERKINIDNFPLKDCYVLDCMGRLFQVSSVKETNSNFFSLTPFLKIRVDIICQLFLLKSGFTKEELKSLIKERLTIFPPDHYFVEGYTRQKYIQDSLKEVEEKFKGI